MYYNIIYMVGLRYLCVCLPPVFQQPGTILGGGESERTHTHRKHVRAHTCCMWYICCICMLIVISKCCQCCRCLAVAAYRIYKYGVEQSLSSLATTTSSSPSSSTSTTSTLPYSLPLPESNQSFGLQLLLKSFLVAVAVKSGELLFDFPFDASNSYAFAAIAIPVLLNIATYAYKSSSSSPATEQRGEMQPLLKVSTDISGSSSSSMTTTDDKVDLNIM